MTAFEKNTLSTLLLMLRKEIESGNAKEEFRVMVEDHKDALIKSTVELVFLLDMIN